MEELFLERAERGERVAGQVEETGPRVSVCGPVKGTGLKESRRRLLDAAQRRNLVQEGVIDVDHV